MLKLTFNTTEKTVKITDEGTILGEYSSVPTVKVREGYYEVMQKDLTTTMEVQIPVCRTPIANTLMFLEK